MVRTQVQLTAEQAASLRQIAVREGVSMAELVRRGVDLLLGARAPEVDSRLRQRALAAAGRFASGCGDLAEAHDQHLEEAFDDLSGAALEIDEWEASSSGSRSNP